MPACPSGAPRSPILCQDRKAVKKVKKALKTFSQGECLGTDTAFLGAPLPSTAVGTAEDEAAGHLMRRFATLGFSPFFMYNQRLR